MKDLRKVLALVIAFTMMLGFGVSASVFPDVADDASYAEAVTTLDALGIMCGDDKGEFRPDATITRAEAAAVVIRAKGLEEASNGAKGATAFSDVAADHWATGYINLASQSGIVNGFTDGTFRPEEPVAYEQIVKMIVAALGYEPKAAISGGYPTGYLIIAAQEKLNQGATGSAGEPAKRSVVARLVFNALDVKMWEVTGVEKNEPVYGKGETTLLTNLDVHVIDGIVDATYANTGSISAANLEAKKVDFNVVSYDGKAASAGVGGVGAYDPDAVVGGMNIYEGDVNVIDYLGMAVKAYIAEDEDGNWEVVAIAPKTGKNQVIELDYSVIEKDAYVDGNKLVYLPEGANRTEDIKLEGTTAKFWNGRSGYGANVDTFLEQNTVIPGSVVLIDNNADDEYDYIFVTQYRKSAVVGEVGATKLIDKNGQTITPIDLKDENKLISFFKDGAAIAMDEIVAGDIVTLTYESTASTSAYINVYVSNATVTGTVTEKRTENGEEIFTIDGKEYKLDNNNAPTVSLTDEGVFYLNVDNRIVYKETAASAVGNYAVMYDAFLTTGLEGATVEVKFFNANGEWITANVNKDAKIHKLYSGTYKGEKIAAGAASANADTGIYTIDAAGTTATPDKGRIFKYTTNAEGQINNIYLEGNAKDKDNFSADANATNGVYNANDLRIGSTYFLNDTVVFSIPDAANMAQADEEDFAVTTVGALFQDDSQYTYKAYDIVDGYPSLVVVTGQTITVDDATRVLVISSITTAKNDNDTEVSKIFGLQAGQEVSALTSEDLKYYNRAGVLCDGQNGRPAAPTLAVGDVVTFSLNAKGEINNIKVLLSYADAKALITAGNVVGATPDNGTTYLFETNNGTSTYPVIDMFGFAAKKESGNLLNIATTFVDDTDLDLSDNLVDAAEGKAMMYRAAAPANFYEINTVRSKVAPVVIEYADMEVERAKSTATYDVTGSWVYVRQLDGVVTDVVVYTANNPT